VLKRRAPHEHVERFRYRDAALEGAPLRESLVTWAVQAAPALRDARPEIPQILDDRAADGWEPLLAIADVAGGDWPTRARHSAVGLCQDGANEDPSIGVRLLVDVATVLDIDRCGDRVTTVDLLNKLTALEEAPWGEWYGKPLNPRGLAKLLKPFAIAPLTIRIDDRTHKGYLREDFRDAWDRYTPSLSVTASHEDFEAKTDPPGPRADSPVTDSDMPETVQSVPNVTDVTDVTDNLPPYRRDDEIRV
jgi:hypothetical protein